MLWYLHLCSVNKIIVTEYLDNATGIMDETENGSGKFTEVTLNPKVKIIDESRIEMANELHIHTPDHPYAYIVYTCTYMHTYIYVMGQ